jgi:hypothetical protein
MGSNTLHRFRSTPHGIVLLRIEFGVGTGQVQSRITLPHEPDFMISIASS